ncbi:MAG: hypothetical protein ACXAC2_03060, partial [Candidatus Kariarchaeaceae archaeon]
TNIKNIPTKIKSRKEKSPKSDEEKEEIKKQRTWELRRNFTTFLSKLLVVIVFPFKIIYGIFSWIANRLRKQDTNPRQAFEEAVAHAALVSMYNELYNKLVKQDHVFTTY